MKTIAIDARKIGDFGIGTYVRGLIGALARLDAAHRYLLLAGPEGPETLRNLPGNFRWVDERSPGYSLRELVTLPRALRRAGADLFHAPHYVLPLGLPCPAIVTVHDLIHLRFPGQRTRLELAYARWMIGRATRIAARVLAVSEATATELVDRFDVERDRVEVIANGVDEEFRREVSEVELAAALAELDLAPGYLLFVGNPKPHKNLERLLEAYSRLRAARAVTPALVLAGDRDGDRSPVSGWIAAAGLEGSVVRVGHLPAARLPALYRGAALLVQPSLWEGFGLPVAEAMAAGVPVVAADRGALPEVAGDAARLVDPDDPAAIAAAIGALLDDPVAAAELGRRGRARSAAFRWQETARRTLAVYRRVLGEGPGSAA
ncbi:MAG: glycosyl transferase [Acidobacteriota bacterium]